MYISVVLRQRISSLNSGTTQCAGVGDVQVDFTMSPDHRLVP